MSKKNIHVTTRSSGWALKAEGSQRASKIFPTQKEAIDAGRAQTQRNGGELLIHNRRGQIRDRDSHGNDPNPPSG